MAEALDPSVNFANAPRPADGGADGGAVGAVQIRLAEHTYTGGGATIAGADRPNPREISNIVFKQTDASGVLIDKPSEAGFSSMLWVWGQFLDHDLDQTANGSAFGTAPITVPTGDPVFAPGSTLGFSRSEFISGTGTSAANPRQYDNDITSYIDGSNIYGSSAAKLAALLVPGTAKLQLTATGTIAFASGDPVFGSGAITGDTRANENVALLSMHALFAREHNRMVDDLAAADPTLTTAQLFEGARARVEAIMQAITYKEFLPILLGENAIADFTGFKSNVNSAISLEFSTAIYRFGHSLLSASIERLNENGSTHALGNLALRDAFNTRGVVEQTGIEAIFRGLSDSMSQEFDTFFVEDVRSLLFGAGGPGTDLAALNIQRGRDHGLPTYNQLRVALGLDPKTSFSQVTSDPEMAARLSQAYGGDISKLDLYVGGLAEDPVGGGIMGETFRLVLIDQFTRLRDGDRFWSEGRGFSAAELEELWSTTLSDVIKRNGNIVDLQDDAFRAYDRVAGDDGANTLTGGSGRNLLIGNGGADTLIGGQSDDHLVGGADGDRLEGRAGANVLVGGAGGDTFVIHVDRSNATTIRDFTALDTIEFANTAGVPAMTITDGPNGAIIHFGGATVLVEGVRAADLPFGGPPPGVTLTGDGKGNVLTGGAGNDTISGNGGNDTLSGLGGRDTVIGGGGADTVSGGDGDDLLTGGSGRDVVNGGDGDDVLFIRGNAAQDDTMTGGAGVDTIRLDDTSADIVLFGTQRITGVEVWEGGGRAVVGSAGADVLDFSIFTTVSGVASLQGLDGNDTIIGAAGQDSLFGGDGDDRLEGRGGANSLLGGAGVDTFVIHVDRANQTTIRDFTAQDLVEFANSAGVPAMTVTDGPNGATVSFGGATVLFEGVAAASLPFAPPPPPGVTLTGNAGANTLTGGAGDDTLSGLAGNDTLNGLARNDSLFGGAAGDTLDGGAGNDTLDGGAQQDVVIGGDGDDVFLIRATEGQTDTMTGGAGLDRIRVDNATADMTLFGTQRISGIEIFEGNGRNLMGSTGDDVFDFSPFVSVTGVALIRGLAGNDKITGSQGADMIRGDIGNDTINGAGGSDALIGNAGADTFVFAGGATGLDTIADFDAEGNDVLLFSGYSFGSANPGGLSTAAKLSAMAAATTFDATGATVHLAAIGGDGEIHLDNATTARLSFTAEDFLFG